MSGFAWEPVGPIAFDDGEIDPVDDAAVEEGAVSASFGQEGGDPCLLGHRIGVARFGEDHSVKHAVNDVAGGSGCDHGQREDKPGGGSFFDHGADEEQQACDGDDPEGGEQDFSEIASEGHPEGHSFVFYEMNDEPIAQNRNALAEMHVGFDNNFDDLVSDEYAGDQPGGFVL